MGFIRRDNVQAWSFVPRRTHCMTGNFAVVAGTFSVPEIMSVLIQ
jgi:hypothetical protein